MNKTNQLAKKLFFNLNNYLEGRIVAQRVIKWCHSQVWLGRFDVLLLCKLFVPIVINGPCNIKVKELYTRKRTFSKCKLFSYKTNLVPGILSISFAKVTEVLILYNGQIPNRAKHYK